MTEQQIAAHAYMARDGKYWFSLPCCRANVGVPYDDEKFKCPECGKGYTQRNLCGKMNEQP